MGAADGVGGGGATAIGSGCGGAISRTGVSVAVDAKVDATGSGGAGIWRASVPCARGGTTRAGADLAALAGVVVPAGAALRSGSGVTRRAFVAASAAANRSRVVSTLAAGVADGVTGADGVRPGIASP